LIRALPVPRQRSKKKSGLGKKWHVGGREKIYGEGRKSGGGPTGKLGKKKKKGKTKNKSFLTEGGRS